MGELFGTDGVRGVANKELTANLAYQLGRAGGYFLIKDLDQKKRPSVIIAKDTRLSGDMLESALAAGFNSVGIDVIKLGIIPTPAVSYLSDEMDVNGGVMISASHNPIADNGIKFFDENGFKLKDEMEDEIERLININQDQIPNPTHNKIGIIKENNTAKEKYISHIINAIDEDLSGIKAIVDCANGAAFEAAPKILKKLGVQITTINDKADGNKINVKCGSTYPEAVAELVKNSEADLGIAHDGDADRVIIVDENGDVVDGDTIMAICAVDMINRGQLKKNTLVTTRYSNLGLKEALEKRDGKVELARNGDRYVLQKMVDNNYNLGGEKSGHIIFLDYNKTGDGILTAVKLMEIIQKNSEKLSEMTKIMDFWPQKLNSVEVKYKNKWQENKLIEETINKAKSEIGDQGRVFVRASGTEPVIRLMFEGKDEKLLEKWNKKLAKVIKDELN